MPSKENPNSASEVIPTIDITPTGGDSKGASIFSRAAFANNPAWAQLLGLCPLLAVSNTVVNALGLAIASLFVVTSSSVTISLLRNIIPHFARLPCFVLIIATFTTITTLLLEAFAFDLYLKIALFVQIIVTNCMILGRAEAYASRQPVGKATLDALGTGIGFALALICLGIVREAIGLGTIGAELDQLFGPTAANYSIQISTQGLLPLALYPPGAFIAAGLLMAFANVLRGLFTTRALSPPAKPLET